MKVSEINEKFIKDIIQNEYPEGSSLDYKSQLNLDTDAEKLDFLCDVCAFVNSGGGAILVGIDEGRDDDSKPNGIPVGVIDQSNVNTDDLAHKVFDICKFGIEPIFNGLRVERIDVDGSIIIAILIDRSWKVPHRVRSKKDSHFYLRTGPRKHRMELDEIKRMVLGAETAIDKIRKFHGYTLGSIQNAINGQMISGDGCMLLFIIPQDSFSLGDVYDLGDERKLAQELVPMSTLMSGGGGWSGRYNLEGYRNFVVGEGPIKSYTQIHRNGIIEAFDSYSFNTETKRLGGKYLCKQVVCSVRKYTKFLNELGAKCPLYIFFSLWGVKDYSIVWQDRTLDYGSPIDRMKLDYSEIVINDYSEKIEVALKPLFDQVWQSAGYSGCLIYDDDGETINFK